MAPFIPPLPGSCANNVNTYTSYSHTHICPFVVVLSIHLQGVGCMLDYEEGSRGKG